MDLYFADGKWERGPKGAEEAMTGLVIFPGIETENPIARAVVDSGVLEILRARHFDFLDVHLDTVPRSLATEERQLPRTS